MLADSVSIRNKVASCNPSNKHQLDPFMLVATTHNPTVTLKMHDLKMTDKENYGSGKCKSGK